MRDLIFQIDYQRVHHGKITNWKQYNKALVNRGSITFWIDEEAISQWYCTTPSGRRGRSKTYSDTAIETVLMLKGIFGLPLRNWKVLSIRFSS